MMTSIPDQLRQSLPEFSPGQNLWVGLSGGLDSCVLLHALVALQLPVTVRALHINHQLSPHADQWQQHCADLCKRWQVPLVAERVNVNRQGKGLEDAARAARYAVFERYLQSGDILLTAHHADDQTETLLLRLVRGAGPRGLAAMARQRPLGAGSLYRPLLGFSRAELQAYAEAQQLSWIDDESNLDVHYDRNFLRHKVIPLLHQRWPQLQRRFQQSADLCADSEILLAELAAGDLLQADMRPERAGQSINLAVLHQWSAARRHNLLRYWLRGQGFDLPEQSHLAQFEQQFIAGRQDAETAVSWGNLMLHRYRGRLYAETRFGGKKGDCAPLTRQSFTLAAQSCRVELAGGGVLDFAYCERVTEPGYLRTDLPDLSLRWRQGGERCQPEGRAHSQTLKKLLQEYALEPWWREQLPLIYCGEQLAAAGDLWVCKGFAASPGQPGYRLSWQPQSVAGDSFY